MVTLCSNASQFGIDNEYESWHSLEISHKRVKFAQNLTPRSAFKEDSMTQPSRIVWMTRLVWMTVLTGALLLMPSRAWAQNGSLKVTSFPSGANVSVDGEDTGKVTPMSISVSVGTHTVVVSIPNSSWNADTRTVDVASGNNDLSVTLLPISTIGPIGPPGPKGDIGATGPPGPAG